MFELNYELMTRLLNKFWNTCPCCTKVQVMRYKILQKSQKSEDGQTKLKNIARDVEASNKNLKENEHKTLGEYVTPRTMLLVRGKVCNIPSEDGWKTCRVSKKVR